MMRCRKSPPTPSTRWRYSRGDKAKEYAAELGLNISDDVKDGLIVITLKKDGQTAASAEATKGKIVIVDNSMNLNGQPLVKAEKMPTFQGGDVNRFAVWMQSQIQYPAEAVEKGISGRVIFSFVVEKDGSTVDFTVLRSPDKVLSAEVERVFNSAPKEWTAGEEKGQKVRVKYTVPIVFAPINIKAEPPCRKPRFFRSR